MNSFADSHAHLTFSGIFEDVEKIIQRAEEKKVTTILNICTDKDSLERGLVLAKKHPNIHNAAAITPHDVEKIGKRDFSFIEDAAKKGYIKIDPFNSINLNAVLFLAKLKKVSQYNVQKRKVFIVKDTNHEEPRIKTKPETDKVKVSPELGVRKFLRVKKDLNEGEKTLNISMTNSVGYVLEKLKIRVVTVEELFESRPWVTTIKELFPYETIEIGYPLEEKDGKIIYGNVLVEASTEDYGKIFSKTFKLAPKE